VHFKTTPAPLLAGLVGTVTIELDNTDPQGEYSFATLADQGRAFPDTDIVRQLDRDDPTIELQVVFTEPGPASIVASHPDGSTFVIGPLDVEEAAGTVQVPDMRVALVPPDALPGPDGILWAFIGQITARTRFDAFHEFVLSRLRDDARLDWFGNGSYQRLRRLADEFLQLATDPVEAVASDATDLQLGPVQAALDRSYVSGERADQAQPFPASLGGRPPASGAPPVALFLGRLRGDRVTGPVQFPLPNSPMVELIWNYWMEEGMLVQTLNHILARFQNRRVDRHHDPLTRFDLSPLLPLRNLLWGFAEDEVHRLTVRRRAAEYQYQYGLELLGRAVPPPSSVVERRTQFLEAFHDLLNGSYAFFKQRDNRMIDADASDVMHLLRGMHLVLSHGAANQFADLAVVARAEMLSMQWILAQPEMRDFLGGPTMVPYDEPWMDRVDTMKGLQGWSDASITHFFELAVIGEQLLLSVRHGRWNEATQTREDAANWAITWRNQIQRYAHAYRTVTGVDLTTTVDATMPSTLIARRLRRRQQA
jgi:hypothetical protein